MKNSIYKLIVLILLFTGLSCSNKTKVYEEEELFIKYLETFLKDDIQHDNYQLLTYRTKLICKTCRQMPLDTVLERSVNEKGNMELYVLFDKQEDMLITKNLYGDKIYYLLGNENDMEKYGIPKTEPLLFTIDKNKITQCKYYTN